MSGKQIMAIGKGKGDGVLEQKVNGDKFLCRGKNANDDECRVCSHNLHKNKDELGLSPQEAKDMLFKKPNTPIGYQEFIKRLKFCFVPDCGNAFFASLSTKNRFIGALALRIKLGHLDEASVLILKAEALGLGDFVSKEALVTILNHINQRAFVQNELINVLIKKGRVSCGNYDEVSSECKKCSIVNKNPIKKVIVSNGCDKNSKIQSFILSLPTSCFSPKFLS